MATIEKVAVIEPQSVAAECVHLKDFMLAMLNERELRYQQSIVTAAEALAKTERGIERRLGEMNEFRAQISKEREDYLQKNEYNVRHDALVEQLHILERTVNTAIKTLDESSGRQRGLNMAWTMLVVVIGLILSAGGIIVSAITSRHTP